MEALITTHSPEGETRQKRTEKYKECLKNHAAAIGGNATDGCGEFMPSGEEGTIEALKCSACHCHRNFHRKVVEGCSCPFNHHHCCSNAGRRIILGHQQGMLSQLVPNSVGYPPCMGAVKGDHHDHGIRSKNGQMGINKKRFRTKFSEEQKAKMLIFAEKAGWKMQKLGESDVQKFCREIGIKRRVLMVWMHNNKHNYTKETSSSK
ncbi:hypothetical protein Nepgr_012215 [Nepenthes gracilis]|uniref:ZF-HD dimerization-type domain-containing protein n=1 Tax=Nepenthes gracilis TaxID=150966 RepID=A0AAD3SGL6_NEPGR|nr:hypothetical protein Nepgr_012215 [Nepenthes gracilis]